MLTKGKVMACGCPMFFECCRVVESVGKARSSWSCSRRGLCGGVVEWRVESSGEGLLYRRERGNVDAEAKVLIPIGRDISDRCTDGGC